MYRYSTTASVEFLAPPSLLFSNLPWDQELRVNVMEQMSWIRLVEHQDRLVGTSLIVIVFGLFVTRSANPYIPNH